MDGSGVPQGWAGDHLAMKNNNTSTDAMVGAYLTALGNDLYFVMIEENEASYDVTDEWTDLTQVGTQAIHRTSLACTDREIDCGAAMVFTAVAAGQVRAVAVLTNATASSPLVLAVQDINGGAVFDMDTYGPLVVDSLVLRFFYEGET